MKRALVAERDEVLRALLVELLTRCGFKKEEVVEVADGREAIREYAADGSFMIIISNSEIPELNGISLYKYIRGIDEEIPFILTSGRPEKLAGANILNGATLQIPFTNEAFMGLVNDLCPPEQT